MGSSPPLPFLAIGRTSPYQELQRHMISTWYRAALRPEKKSHTAQLTSFIWWGNSLRSTALQSTGSVRFLARKLECEDSQIVLSSEMLYNNK